MRKLWNNGWMFNLNPSRDDLRNEEWKPVKLPHDWLIYDTSDLYRDGYGRYRRTFNADIENIRTEDRHVFVIFDGVYMDSEYYLNGERIGEWKYGYSQYVLELTDHLKNGENELTVCVNYKSPNSRWYSGAGIYRDVWYTEVPSTYIPENGIYIHVQRSPLPVYTDPAGTSSAYDGTDGIGNGTLKPAAAEHGYDIYIDTEICGNGIEDKALERLTYCLKDADDAQVPMAHVSRRILRNDEYRHYICEETSMGHRELIVNDSLGTGAVFHVLDVYHVDHVREWSTDEPYLYRLYTRLENSVTRTGEDSGMDASDAVNNGEHKKESALQTVVNRIGFKTAFCDVDKGFFLNGRHIKLNGVCEHHDLGVLGAEFRSCAMRRKIEILKGMGVNAIRGTHNMMAPGLLDLCDEMGILYISEAFDMWNHPKTSYDYARFFDEWHERDVASWIRRDRNHTCVIMWSIGNEIADIHNFESEGQAMTRELMEMAASHDYLGNAYITQGSNYMPWINAQKCADILKVAGYNYAESCYAEHHKEHPDWIIYGSETSSITQSRGVYHLPLSANSLGEEDDQCSALGNSTTSWSAKSYELCAALDRDMEFSQGQFLWSGFDYIGEPTPYKTRNSYFGQIDTAGFPKDSYYFWKSVWTAPEDGAFVHIFPYWDFNEGQIVDVRVVSNLPEVELSINGRSLGRQRLDHAPGSGYHLIADYQVPYEKGELYAAAYASAGDSEPEACAVRHSFGDTDHLACKKYEFSSTAAQQDLIFYEISALDKDGYPVENACDRVNVTVTGRGRLTGLDNGDSSDPDGYRVNSRRLFNGRLLVCVDTHGENSGTNDTYSGFTDVRAGQSAVNAACVSQNDENGGLIIHDTAFGNPVEVRLTRVIEDADIRRITLKCDESRQLTPDHDSVTVCGYAYPGQAADHVITYRIVDDLGIDSHLADLEITKRISDGNPCDEVRITAKGDGHFRLRATAGAEGQRVRVISDLEFDITGCGQAYRDPYEFIAGSTYSSSIGEASNGNEKGFATSRSDRTVVIFDDLDFGSSGADSITIPIFALDSDDVPLKVWEGVPGSGSERLLLDTLYSKPRQWAVFIEDTWKLNHRVTGIRTISFEFVNKVHVRGFVFGRADKARMKLYANEADTIYGDDFARTDLAVERIGNNVSLEFKHMNFGEKGIDSISICGRTPNETNPVHVRFFRADESIQEVCEFKASDKYTEQIFKLPHVTGKWDVSFVFLPGSCFDFQAFRFE